MGASTSADALPSVLCEVIYEEVRHRHKMLYLSVDILDLLCYDRSQPSICEKGGYLQRMTSYGLPASLRRWCNEESTAKEKKWTCDCSDWCRGVSNQRGCRCSETDL